MTTRIDAEAVITQVDADNTIIDAPATKIIEEAQVIAKFKADNNMTMLEMQEHLECETFLESLEDNVVASLNEGADRLEVIQTTFGSDSQTVVENMLNTDEATMAIAMLSLAEGITITEAIVKHVDSKGQITRKKDRKTRARLATQTTGLSKSKRRQIARKAAKTKKANPSGTTRANRKRKKAVKRRSSMGL